MWGRTGQWCDEGGSYWLPVLPSACTPYLAPWSPACPEIHGGFLEKAGIVFAAGLHRIRETKILAL